MFLNYFFNYLFFIFEVITIIIAIIGLFLFVSFLSSKAKNLKKGFLNVQLLNKSYQIRQERIAREILDKTSIKKIRRKNQLLLKKINQSDSKSKTVFIINFCGDIKATQTKSLSEEVTSILQVAKSGDEVFVRLDSPGGSVNGYGLAAAQLERIKAAKLKLTISVDQVAASGGYMMACVADKIIAAPFAILGSVGVVAQLPNINRFLTDKGVDIELHTAGKYKRTLTLLGENSDSGRKKFKQDLVVVHQLFKNHISTYRPDINIDKISTGEYWFGSEAMKLKLIDQVLVGDDYLLEKYNTGKYKLLHIEYKVKKSKFLGIWYSLIRGFNKIGL